MCIVKLCLFKYFKCIFILMHGNKKVSFFYK